MLWLRKSKAMAVDGEVAPTQVGFEVCAAEEANPNFRQHLPSSAVRMNRAHVSNASSQTHRKSAFSALAAPRQMDSVFRDQKIQGPARGG